MEPLGTYVFLEGDAERLECKHGALAAILPPLGGPCQMMEPEQRKAQWESGSQPAVVLSLVPLKAELLEATLTPFFLRPVYSLGLQPRVLTHTVPQHIPNEIKMTTYTKEKQSLLSQLSNTLIMEIKLWIQISSYIQPYQLTDMIALTYEKHPLVNMAAMKNQSFNHQTLLSPSINNNDWEQVFSWKGLLRGRNAIAELWQPSCHQEGRPCLKVSYYYLLRNRQIQKTERGWQADRDNMTNHFCKTIISIRKWSS